MFTRKEKYLLFSLALIQFSHIVDFMILMPLGPQLMRVFEITPAQFGFLVSSYTFAAGVSGLIAARFIDRFDRKTTLLFFYIGFCLSTVACAFSPSYEFFLLARTLAGAFGGVLGSLVLAIVGDAIAPERRGTATGTVMMAFSLASIVGVPFSLYLASKTDWHGPFFFLGFLSLLMTGFIYYAIPKMTSHLDRPPSHDGLLKIIKDFWMNPSTRSGFLFMAALIFGQFTVISFFSPSLVANSGLKEADLPLIYLVGGIVSIFSSPLVGALTDRLGKKKVFLVGAGFSILPILAATHLSQVPMYVVFLITAFFFVSMGGRMIPASSLVTSAVPSHSRGSYMSLIASLQQFASGCASLLAGQIVARGADGTLMNYNYIGYIAVAATLAAIYFSNKIVEL